ncbi:AhpC/TSA family protein [Planctomycetes bacterium Poly30]|uniref:AhpC/TSA family protein n=1 Tax=Saltatorellus ferox TaxID=2528018 RepID=A0A518F0A5_9BACT|nr:AhpC/TSA family protein [Planctomycetes bacterium Poly30]
MGAQLFGICPQRFEHSEALKQQLGLAFELLHDEDNLVGEAFGLVVDTPDAVREVEMRLGLDLPMHNGTSDWKLPMPARVVIGTDGIVRSATVQTDHALRPEPEETIQLLRKLIE